MQEVDGDRDDQRDVVERLGSDPGCRRAPGASTWLTPPKPESSVTFPKKTLVSTANASVIIRK